MTAARAWPPADRAWPPGVSPGQPFGDLEVIRTGVRGGHTQARPRGFPAAECTCHGPGCGQTVIVPLYRLLNGNTRSCGCGACFRPRKTGIRDAIEALVTEAADAGPGGMWMADIRDKLGMTNGQAGGHLYHLLTAGRLDRPVRGFYCPPGRRPDPIPPPSERASARSTKSGRSRWANMDAEARQAVVGRLTAGRDRARYDAR